MPAADKPDAAPVNRPDKDYRPDSANGVDPIKAVDPASTSARHRVQEWRDGQSELLTDDIVDEVAVALVYNGISHVVMMTTPVDLEAFALGFSLTEGILGQPSELYELVLNRRESGIEIAMTISAERFNQLKQARRNLTGRTGCGLCGA